MNTPSDDYSARWNEFINSLTPLIVADLISDSLFGCEYCPIMDSCNTGEMSAYKCFNAIQRYFGIETVEEESDEM
jgi:hypothetical protein